MLIDFSTISQLIPKDGRLILTFTKKVGKAEDETEKEQIKEMNVVFAQQFKGKENDNDFAPIIISGTVEELNLSFESMATEIGRGQTKLAELKALPAVRRVDAKKKQISEAIKKTEKATTPAGKKDEPKKEPAKEEPKKPQMVDLFASLRPKDETPPPATLTVNPPSEPSVEEVTVDEEGTGEEVGEGGAE